MTKKPEHPPDYYTNKLMPVKTIVDKQYRKGRYNRMDMIVRLMCIEEYEKTKHTKGYWWKFYKKMQQIRIRKIATVNKSKFYPGFPKRRIKDFVATIESFREKGYDLSQKSIRCDKNLELANGSHRLALCIHFGIPEIPIKWPSDSTTPRRGYSLKWFYKHNFKLKDLKELDKKRAETIKKLGLKDRETNNYIKDK